MVIQVLICCILISGFLLKIIHCFICVDSPIIAYYLEILIPFLFGPLPCLLLFFSWSMVASVPLLNPCLTYCGRFRFCIRWKNHIQLSIIIICIGEFLNHSPSWLEIFLLGSLTGDFRVPVFWAISAAFWIGIVHILIYHFWFRIWGLAHLAF